MCTRMELLKVFTLPSQMCSIISSGEMTRFWWSRKYSRRLLSFLVRESGTPFTEAFSCSGIKGKLIPFQAYILLNKFPPGKASDPGFQLLKMKGFGKIIIGAQIQTVYFIFNLIPGGQDQNRGIGIVFPELTENFQTVRAGKDSDPAGSGHNFLSYTGKALRLHRKQISVS